MYIPYKKKEKAFIFKVWPFSIYTVYHGKWSNLNLELDELSYFSDDKNLRLSYSFNDKFYFENLDEKGIIIVTGNDLNVQETLEMPVILVENPPGVQVICRKYENKTKTISLYDLEKQKLIWAKDTNSKYEWRNYNIFEKHFVYTTDRDKAVFNFADKLTGEVLWSFDLHKDMKLSEGHLEEKEGVYRFIGLHQNILLTGLSNGLLLGIDIETGQQDFVIEQSEDSVTGKNYNGLISGRFAKFSPDRRKLVALSASFFSVFDLESKQVERVRDLEKDMKKHFGEFISFRDFSFVNEQQLVFTAQTLGKGIEARTIGIFDLKTEKIEWLHDMGFEKGVSFNAGTVPHVIGDRIYINDSNGTLYVFEKE